MSGFDKTWLALREPADIAARHGALVQDLAGHLASLENARILDIGCGTGSTWRSLSDRLPGDVNWHLLDYDPTLLQEAARQIGLNSKVGFLQHDLNDIAALPLDGVDVVTASALFDLCSEQLCTDLADRLASARIGLYAALNYNGLMHWSLPHPLDGEIVDLFNRHQRTDKGLGTALGPDATDCLTRVLTARGFRVKIEDSPWRLDANSRALQIELLNGLRQPLLEMKDLPEAKIDEWLGYRRDMVGEAGSLCLVGHADLLALPL
ncbi:methyltransferase domain-containing protein [Rhizobium sp. CG5]|uniref:class I SAM-dependent methyltransferase n=1 Tax=Rhizobium sp. CG5 TaxID=2726076 RepID=UPI0020341D79|nr:methyltransferase domain-containing protein [Rhizobium sp. CG5]MCM2472301.1 methyltransferase domain-containing protein [Rhizobium sp. CG5]